MSTTLSPSNHSASTYHRGNNDYNVKYIQTSYMCTLKKSPVEQCFVLHIVKWIRFIFWSFYFADTNIWQIYILNMCYLYLMQYVNVMIHGWLFTFSRQTRAPPNHLQLQEATSLLILTFQNKIQILCKRLVSGCQQQGIMGSVSGNISLLDLFHAAALKVLQRQHKYTNLTNRKQILCRE